MSRICPDCHIALTPKSFHGITIDACSRCAGIFFDDGEMSQLKKMGLRAMEELEDMVTPTVTVEATTDKLRCCPSCGVGMDEFRYMYDARLLLDQCDHCGGIWVQDGELDRISHILREGGASEGPVLTVTGKGPLKEGRVGKVTEFLRIFGRKANAFE